MPNTAIKKVVFIDPSYPAYYEDRLFDCSNPTLNRDGTLEPLARLKSALNHQDIEIHTADYLFENKIEALVKDYYSLGMMENYPTLIGRPDVRMRGFLIMEPPVVAPKLYRALPKLTRYFERVYLHNTDGDGYSLKGVDQSRLHKLYWPQPYQDVVEPYWHNEDRLKRIVVINGNHIPRSFRDQLYGRRIEAMSQLAKLGVVDLYGRGWDQWWSHRSMWPPYWLNYKTLMSIYHGSCESKYQVLSRYTFSLCFENMAMKGYVTEKLFDCLYAGTIPLYLGAKNIDNLIPSEVYVDCRNFASWREMSDKVMSMTDSELVNMREAGRTFIKSEEGLKYYNSMLRVVYD
jgi:hypothetical protein